MLVIDCKALFVLAIELSRYFFVMNKQDEMNKALVTANAAPYFDFKFKSAELFFVENQCLSSEINGGIRAVRKIHQKIRELRFLVTPLL